MHTVCKTRKSRIFKGTVSRDFLLQAPENYIRIILIFFIAEIFPSQRAPPVSTTPATNFATSIPLVLLILVAIGINDIGSKFTTGHIDGK
jgi:hypothetical protein